MLNPPVVGGLAQQASKGASTPSLDFLETSPLATPLQHITAPNLQKDPHNIASRATNWLQTFGTRIATIYT